MSGALAERDFVEKLQQVGFVALEVVERKSYGVEETSLYPLFTDDLRELMYELIPPEQQDRIATSVVVKARARPQDAADT